MIGSASLLFGLVGAVLANEVSVPTVLYRGDNPGLASARVYAAASLEESGVEASALNPITVSEAMAGKQPVLIGHGEVSACSGTRQDMKALRDAVERAESGVSYMEFDQAISHLYTANTALSCLEEPAHPSVAARLFFLQGVVFHAKENEPRALASFRQALSFEPDLSWDDYMAPDGKPLFEQVVEESKNSARVSVRLVPTPEDGTLWVDGRLVVLEKGAVSLAPGEHVVQVVGSQAVTVRLRLDSVDTETVAGDERARETNSKGESASEDTAERADAAPVVESMTLVVPGAITADHLGWILDSEKQADLDLVLATALREGEPVYVSVGSEVFGGTVGSGVWESLEVPVRLGFSDGLGSRRVTSQVLMWSGGATAAVSGLLVGINYLRVMDSWRIGSADTVTFDSYEENKGLYEGGVSRMKAGGIVGASGLAMAATGYLLRPKSTGVSLVPIVAPGMAGAWLEVR